MSTILEVKDLLNEYSIEVQDAIEKKAQEVAKDGQNKLRATSPQNERNTPHKGKYAKGWKVNVVKGKGFIKCTIHNPKDYRLTHLLERGHLTRNGNKTMPIKHIEPVHDECCRTFEREVEKIINNGG